MFGGVYIVTGGFVRRELSTLAYTLICYGACGVLLLVVCLVGGQPLTGYAADDWVRIAALTVSASCSGTRCSTSCCARSARRSSRSRRCSRCRCAAMIAAFALGQTPPAAAVPALALLLVAGTALVISARERAPAEAT